MKKNNLFKSASLLTLGAAVSLIISTASSARALLINGSFKTGYQPGWTTVGNTTIKQAIYRSGSVDGASEALLTG